MSWNATVDRLRARAQHEALTADQYTRRLLYEAVDEITRQAERVPNPDDLLEVVTWAERWRAVAQVRFEDPMLHMSDVIDRVRATMEEA